MRKLFIEEIYNQMRFNKDIWFLTGDVGFRILDNIKQDFPERFLNCGTSEQAMMDIGIGLAMSGKIPFLYTITPFLLYRPFESIRNYVNREKCPVKLIGIGRDRDYFADGFTHWAEEDRKIMENFENIKCFFPENDEQVKAVARICVINRKPTYVNLRR